MKSLKSILFCGTMLALVVDASATTMSWLPVGNAGNVADTAVRNDLTSGYGSVPYAYNIARYDVTNGQYVEFLNLKDAAGANVLGLYNIQMTVSAEPGINFDAGAPNGSKYSVISGDQNHPVTFIDWYDATRFANWMNNGQGNGDTETGAYTLLGGTPTPSNANAITRKCIH